MHLFAQKGTLEASSCPRSINMQHVQRCGDASTGKSVTIWLDDENGPIPIEGKRKFKSVSNTETRSAKKQKIASDRETSWHLFNEFHLEMEDAIRAVNKNVYERPDKDAAYSNPLLTIGSSSEIPRHVRRLAQMLKALRYMGIAEFDFYLVSVCKKLLRHINDVTDSMRDKPRIVLLLPETTGKSNLWVSLKAWPHIRNHITGVISLGDVDKENAPVALAGNKTMYVIMDDGIFSGTQMAANLIDRVETFRLKPTMIRDMSTAVVAVVAASKDAYDRMHQIWLEPPPGSSISLRGTIPVSLPDVDDFTRTHTLLVGSLLPARNPAFENQIPFYFGHKVPDSVSVPIVQFRQLGIIPNLTEDSYSSRADKLTTVIEPLPPYKTLNYTFRGNALDAHSYTMSELATFSEINPTALIAIADDDNELRLEFAKWTREIDEWKAEFSSYLKENDARVAEYVAWKDSVDAKINEYTNIQDAHSKYLKEYAEWRVDYLSKFGADAKLEEEDKLFALQTKRWLKVRDEWNADEKKWAMAENALRIDDDAWRDAYEEWKDEEDKWRREYAEKWRVHVERWHAQDVERADAKNVMQLANESKWYADEIALDVKERRAAKIRDDKVRANAATLEVQERKRRLALAKHIEEQKIIAAKRHAAYVKKLEDAAREAEERAQKKAKEEEWRLRDERWLANEAKQIAMERKRRRATTDTVRRMEQDEIGFTTMPMTSAPGAFGQSETSQLTGRQRLAWANLTDEQRVTWDALTRQQRVDYLDAILGKGDDDEGRASDTDVFAFDDDDYGIDDDDYDDNDIIVVDEDSDSDEGVAIVDEDSDSDIDMGIPGSSANISVMGKHQKSSNDNKWRAKQDAHRNAAWPFPDWIIMDNRRRARARERARNDDMARRIRQGEFLPPPRQPVHIPRAYGAPSEISGLTREQRVVWANLTDAQRVIWNNLPPEQKTRYIIISDEQRITYSTRNGEQEKARYLARITLTLAQKRIYWKLSTELRELYLDNMMREDDEDTSDTDAAGVDMDNDDVAEFAIDMSRSAANTVGSAKRPFVDGKCPRGNEADGAGKQSSAPPKTLIRHVETGGGVSTARYWPRYLSGSTRDKVWASLGSLTYIGGTAKMLGKTYTMPRQTVGYATVPGLSYKFSDKRVLAMYPMPAAVDELRRSIEATTGARYNFVLINEYKNNGETVGWHADGESDMVPKSTVAFISIGATHPFQMRRNDRSNGERSVNVSLEDGDLLTMEGSFQQHYQHAIPRRALVSDMHYDLTFRTMREAGKK